MLLFNLKLTNQTLQSIPNLADIYSQEKSSNPISPQNIISKPSSNKEQAKR